MCADTVQETYGTWCVYFTMFVWCNFIEQNAKNEEKTNKKQKQEQRTLYT